MSDSVEQFRRLARSFFGLSSLWVGPDHLVYVRGRGFIFPYTEEYKRYRFADIQAVTVARRSRWTLGLTLGLSMGFCAVIGLLLLGLNPGARSGAVLIVAGVFTLIALLLFAFFLRHLLLGPLCICEIQTSASRERLRAIDRLHQSEQLVEQLAGPIGAAQADLQAGASEATSAERSSPPQAPFQLSGSVFATAAGFLLLAMGGFAILHAGSSGLVVAYLILMLAGSALLVWSLVSSTRVASPDGIRASLWTLLGLFFLTVAGGVVILLVAGIQDPAYTIDLAGPFEALADVREIGGWVAYGFFASLFGLMTLTSSITISLFLKWKARLSAIVERGSLASD
ncbi:MAG: hypothetical protein AAF236_02545 [Verrucomicrobiota bacterium]